MIWTVFGAFSLGIAFSIGLHYLYRPGSVAEMTDIMTKLQARITAVKQLEGLVTIQQLGKVTARIDELEQRLAEQAEENPQSPMAMLQEWQEIATMFGGSTPPENDDE